MNYGKRSMIGELFDSYTLISIRSVRPSKFITILHTAQINMPSTLGRLVSRLCVPDRGSISLYCATGSLLFKTPDGPVRSMLPR